MTGNRKHFYYYDLEANKLEKIPGVAGGQFANSQLDNGDSLSNLSHLFVSKGSDYFAFAGGESGTVAVMGQKTKKLLFELKMPSSSCTSVGFGKNNHTLYTVGSEAEIYQWDLRQANRCVSKTADEGNFNTTHMCMSADGSQLATGSHSGTVNIYKAESTGLQRVKQVMNLTTAVSDLKFDETGQLLAVCSKWKKNAVRLIHTGAGGSYNVYQNFPAGHAVGVLRYPLTMGFSCDSQYFAMGNDEGRAHLWHLSNFGQSAE
jgi:U3 small nucleolar RNA-associated protein 18